MGAEPAIRDGARAIDPAQAAAEGFRALLDAMARPGQVRALAHTAPEGVSPAAAGLLAVLADAETPVWWPDRLRGGPAEAWLRFETNAPLAAPETAVFALGDWDELLPLSRWPAGTPDYPDRSVTLVVELAALEGGPRLSLSGPGIAGRAEIAPALPEGAAAELGANAARFPLGVDLVLAAGAQILALPRSTKVEG